MRLENQKHSRYLMDATMDPQGLGPVRSPLSDLSTEELDFMKKKGLSYQEFLFLKALDTQGYNPLIQKMPYRTKWDDD